MAKELLHLVFGVEIKDPNSAEFVDTAKLDLVGNHPDDRTAHPA